MPSQMALHKEEEINQQHQQQQKQTMKVLSTYKRLSLWLIPPEPILSSLSCTQKQLISLHMSEQQQNKKKAPLLLLPTFIPHITLVGGVPISECCSMEDDVLPQLLSLQQQQEKNHSSNNKDDCDDNGNQFTTIDIDELAAQSVLKRLQCAFRNFGGVQCNFVKERGVFAATRRRQRRATRNDESDIGDNTLINGGKSAHKMNVGDDKDSNGKQDDKEEQLIEEVQWNQSCIAIMERSTDFINAMEVADKALFSHRYNSNKDGNHDGQSSSKSLERHFKAPSCEPHYSFVYGNDASLIQSLSERSINSSNSINGGDDEESNDRDPMILECPPNFTSTEIMVMWTYPSTLEGVEQWREIGRFSLV